MASGPHLEQSVTAMATEASPKKNANEARAKPTTITITKAAQDNLSGILDFENEKNENNKNESDDSNDEKEKNLLSLDSDDFIDFDKIAREATFRRSKFLNEHQNSIHSRGGFVINQTTMLRLHIDSLNYVTVPIKPNTTVSDAISIVRSKRLLEEKQECCLLYNGQVMDDNENLYQIISAHSNSGHYIELQMKTPLGMNMNDVSESNNMVGMSLNGTYNNNSNNLAGPYTVSKESIDNAKKVASMGRSERQRQRKRSQAYKVNLSVMNQFTISQSEDSDEHRDAALLMSEKLLRALPESRFDVIKINDSNRKQKRILKIGISGIGNIRPATLTSKEYESSFHTWENVLNCYLENNETIRIGYADRQNERRYQTKQAKSIEKEIKKRIDIIKDQKTRIGRQEISFDFQKKLLNSQINKSKEFNIGDYVRLTRGRSGHIIWQGKVNFAPYEHYGIELDEPDTIHGHNGEINGKRYFSIKQDMCGVIVPKTHIIRKINIKKTSFVSKSHSFQDGNKNDKMSSLLNSSLPPSLASASPTHGAKVSKMMGNDESSTVEEAIFSDIKTMILSKDLIEGRYRQDFFNKFPKYMKEDPDNILHTVRDWMDAIKKRINAKHGEKYKKRLKSAWQQQKQRYQMSLENESKLDDLRNNNNTNNNNNDNDNDNDRNETKDEKEQNDRINNIPIGNTQTVEQSQINEIINRLIESSVEQTVLQPKLKDLIQHCYNKKSQNIAIFKLKIEKLINKDQAFFGIKEELTSENNWNRAVYELTLLQDCILPSEKIQSLVNTSHAVYLQHNEEQKKKRIENSNQNGKKKKDNFISGDDFLPIVIYVIVQASRKRPAVTDADLEFMEGLVDPELNRSEPGYYLAVFHAACQWIGTFSEPK